MYAFQNPSDETVRRYLQDSKTIAVVGLSDREETTSYQVSRSMQEAGYQIIPVNPRKAGATILGQVVYARLQEIPFHVNVVNVFRRSACLPDVARDFLKTDADIFWAQLGLENRQAEDLLRATERNEIVMNRCIKVEYQRLLET